MDLVAIMLPSIYNFSFSFNSFYYQKLLFLQSNIRLVLLIKVFLTKKCNVVLCSQWNIAFPHEFIFAFILHFMGTIMTTSSSSSIYSWDNADFRVQRPESRNHFTMCIPIVTFSFPDNYEHSKNQLNSFIRSWDAARS